MTTSNKPLVLDSPAEPRLSDIMREALLRADPAPPTISPSGQVTSVKDALDLPRSRWFRGQGNGRLHLLPKLTRPRPGTAYRLRAFRKYTEGAKTTEWRRAAHMLLPAGCSDVEAYLWAQHFGFPTRLLDWTASPLVGLYFAAVSKRDKKRDGGLFVLNPSFPLTAHAVDSTLPDTGPFPEDWPAVSNEIARVFGHAAAGPALRGRPVPIAPTMRFPRLSQQESRFTFHPDRPEPFPEGAVELFSVPAGDKDSILEELSFLGITRGRLFGDLDSLTTELMETWFNEESRAGRATESSAG